MQDSVECISPNTLHIRKLKSICSTRYDPSLKVYSLEVKWRGENHIDQIFLPETILMMAQPNLPTQNFNPESVSVSLEGCEADRLGEINQKEHLNGWDSKLPGISLEELKKRTPSDLVMSMFKKEEEDSCDNLL
jgi:hypothetical protein